MLIAISSAVYLLQTGDEQRFFEMILRFGVTPEIFTGGDRIAALPRSTRVEAL